MKEAFRFKQFCVAQDRCAMKVGTDGVLLGAWAEGGRCVLDIGTGTGLIALMLAQRYGDAAIEALEIDHAACLQAAENVADSPFSKQVRVIEGSLQTFVTDTRYDAIVSNPPFYAAALHAPDRRRALARQTESLPFAELIRHARALLAPGGTFSVIVPTASADGFINLCALSGLLLKRRCEVCTVSGKPPKRSLLAFSDRRQGPAEVLTATMSYPDGSKTAWYQALTSAFYL